MRLWSVHPKYLDAKGLVALWREALLARKVLSGLTRGYKNHPQLLRFIVEKHPLDLINSYLFYVYKEAKRRGYNFDISKIKVVKCKKIKVTDSQLKYEFNLLLNKLKKRDYNKYLTNLKIKKIMPNRIFKIIKGDIERWEKIKNITNLK
ncbi:MAG: pyrimidine dimer DNA glycosylase/endonuclease V [Candidatus Goldbacteria bacterium]|nr:pyrimidine dimer DNA glycosylase/endonuclease V [Candidatus Goldiibacteriota bacterium]